MDISYKDLQLIKEALDSYISQMEFLRTPMSEKKLAEYCRLRDDVQELILKQ